MGGKWFSSNLYVMMLCIMSILSPLYGASLEWDSAGMNGLLDNLDIGTNDTNDNPVYYQDGQHYDLDGFLGRFVYQGPANNTLTFTNSGPVASGPGTNSNAFYYTKDNNTARWRRVFLVGTMKGWYHSGGSTSEPIGTSNTIITSQGDTLVIPVGAGPEQVSPSDPGYSGGYDASGTWGNGPAYVYAYPYAYIWIDLTVVRTRDSSGFKRNDRGGYQSKLMVRGDDVALQLMLTGYYSTASAQGDSYAFELERACPETIPFEELLACTTAADSYLVGYVRYYSVDTLAKIYFAADELGSSVDFRFSSDRGSFPYSVVYNPIEPQGSLVPINSINNRIWSTTSPIPYYSPIYGEQQDRYVLHGEIRIHVSSGLQSLPLPADAYSSKIYVFLVSP